MTGRVVLAFVAILIVAIVAAAEVIVFLIWFKGGVMAEELKQGKVVFGETCFAEYQVLKEDSYNYETPWTVRKYDTDWEFSLGQESDAMELMRRLDQRAAGHPLRPGI